MITGDCILATGRPGNHGYYRTTRNGITYLAHRLAYQEAKGRIPPGWQVHHLCHNKQCINPAHLEALPHGDHVRVHGLTGWAAIHAAATTCANGHPFDGHNGYQRTCSICMQENRERYNERHMQRHTCIVCGQDFESPRRKQNTCGPSCRGKRAMAIRYQQTEYSQCLT